MREAVEHVGGAKEAVKFAKQRHVLWKVHYPTCAMRRAARLQRCTHCILQEA